MHRLGFAALVSAGLATVGCGGNWQNEGQVAPNQAVSGKIFALNGTQYAAYVDSTTSKLTVAKYSGGHWSTVGDTGLIAYDYDYALSVDGTTPYLAAINSSTNLLSVLQYNGSWSAVGGTGPAANTTALYMAVKSGTVYVGYTDASGSFHVQSASGSSWTDLGFPQGATATSPNQYALGLHNGTPYVFYGDSSSVTIASWSGTQWTTVATSTTGLDYDDSRCAGFAPTLMESNGTLYVSYYNGTLGAVFMQLSGSSLTPVGTLGSISNGDSVECVSGAVYNGTPYVAFDDESRDGDPQPKAATVKIFQGGAWALYAGYPSPNDIEGTQLIVDPSDGHLYLTYEDDTVGGMTVQVR